MVPFFVYHIFINKQVMNIRRILIPEQEKKDILSQYGVKKDVISEQTLNSDGTYVVKRDQVFYSSGEQLGGSASKVYVRKDTIVYPDKDGKSVIFNVYYKENNQFKLSGSKGKLNCGQNIINVGSQTYQQAPDTGQPFKTTINKMFCGGDILKTKKTETKQKSKTIKLTLSDEEKCLLPNDNVWQYAKQKDRWFASKNGIDWFDITNNSKATTLLKSSCKSLKDILAFIPPVISDDETLPPIPTSPDSKNVISKNNAPDMDNEVRNMGN